MVKETITGRGATLEEATQKLYAGVPTFAKDRGYVAPEDPAAAGRNYVAEIREAHGRYVGGQPSADPQVAFQSAQGALAKLTVDPERVRLSAVYDLQPIKRAATATTPAVTGRPSGAAPADYRRVGDVTDRIM